MSHQNQRLVSALVQVLEEFERARIVIKTKRGRESVSGVRDQSPSKLTRVSSVKKSTKRSFQSWPRLR